MEFGLDSATLLSRRLLADLDPARLLTIMCYMTLNDTQCQILLSEQAIGYPSFERNCTNLSRPLQSQILNNIRRPPPNQPLQTSQILHTSLLLPLIHHIRPTRTQYMAALEHSITAMAVTHTIPNRNAYMFSDRRIGGFPRAHACEAHERGVGRVDSEQDFTQVEVLQCDGDDALRAGEIGPGACELFACVGIHVQRGEGPGLGVVPLVDFVVQVFPFVFADSVVGVFEDGLEDGGEEEDDAVCPGFFVEFAEYGRVAVVF
jgi:hypothetical protein